MSTSTIKTLKDDFCIKTLTEIFNKSFADYVVPLQVTEVSLGQKISAENVLPEYSIGLFNNDTGALEGFLLHAVDDKENPCLLYNSATGVIPTARGRAIERCYNAIRPYYESKGIKSVILEAVTTNSRAIRAYEKCGFVSQRVLSTFKGQINSDQLNQLLGLKPIPDNIRIQKVSELSNELYKFIDKPKQNNDNTPVMVPLWSNNIKSIKREFDIGANHIWTATTINEKGEEIIVGYISLYTTTYRLRQIYVLPEYRNKNIATALINTVVSSRGPSSDYNINIDESFKNIINFFTKRIGFTYFLSVTEMLVEYNKL